MSVQTRNFDTTISDTKTAKHSDAPVAKTSDVLTDSSSLSHARLSDVIGLRGSKSISSDFRADDDLLKSIVPTRSEKAGPVRPTDVARDTGLREVAITDKTAVTAGREKVQEYAETFRKNFDKIDTTGRGLISPGDLELYLKNPNLTSEERNMATFFKDNFEFIKGLNKYQLKPGDKDYRGNGLTKFDADILESLTDPEKFKSLVKGQAFSWWAAGISGGATMLAGSIMMANGLLSTTMSGAGMLALTGAGFLVGTAGALAVAAGVGLGVGYLLHQRNVREHYSEKRKALEQLFQR